jgi:fatty acid desaturase
MRIPCYHLPKAAQAIKEAFPERTIDRKLRIREFVKNTRTCKLYDVEAGRWHPYSAADRKPAGANWPRLLGPSRGTRRGT